MAESNPLDEAAAFLATAIGSDEATLRGRLGNDGYEKYKADEARLTEIRIRDADVHVEQHAGSTRYINAKGTFWKAMAFAVSVSAVTGVGWSIWEWVR